MTHRDNVLDALSLAALSSRPLIESPSTMVRLRRVPVLLSTLALVAGCGSADRVEVSGVVRDGRTGSPLAGARVTGADGVATHTDAEGRFTLAVMRGLRTQLRVSAEGHADAVQSFGVDAFVVPASLAFELEPLVVYEDEAGTDPDAVVRWSTGQWRTGDWVAQRFSRGHAEAQHDQEGIPDAGWIDGGGGDPVVDPASPPSCAAATDRLDTAEGSLREEPEDPVLTVGGVEAPWLGAGAACVSCHRDGDAGYEANVIARGPHAGLGDACLSCHAEDGSFAPTACARCHAEGVGDDTNRTWHVELDVVVAGHPSYERAVARAREAMAARIGADRRDELEVWVEWITRDRSRGAHDPSAVRRLDALTH